MNKKSNILNKAEYKVEEAIEIIKKNSKRNFIESLDMQIKLEFNSKSDQALKSSLLLPYFNGKKNVLVAIVEKEYIDEALNCGADYAGLEEIIEKIQNKSILFNKVLVKTNLFSKITKLAKILGPKDLMPSLKTKTVTEDIFETIKEYKSRRIILKSDKSGNIGLSLGKITNDSKEIKENFIFILDSIKKNKNSLNKNFVIKYVYLSSTRGKSCRIIL